MRTFSSTAHVVLIRRPDGVGMLVDEQPVGNRLVDDPTLPAVRHLRGPDASDIVGAAVEAAGGVLHALRLSQAHYRPGREFVAQFRADVTWADGRLRRDETLLGAIDTDGALPGTIPVVATADGDDLTVGVWRWPFDPLVPGIELAATPGQAEHLLAPHIGTPTRRDVVAYRPTDRAVVRVTGSDGGTVYLKAVRPADVAGLADAHLALTEAGLPVPPLLGVDADTGLVLLAELPGTTLRERIKGDLPNWPDPGHLADVVAAIASLDGAGLPTRAGRMADAVQHARLVRTVAPAQSDRLDRICALLDDDTVSAAARPATVVHGDLHEGQLIVDEAGTITGLLDIDDLAVGDPLDDVITMLGHLEFRCLLAADQPTRDTRLGRFVDQLRHEATERFDSRTLDLGTAAVLVGLATGPFRAQSDGWEAEIDRVLGRAAVLAGVDDASKSFLSPNSRMVHGHPAS